MYIWRWELELTCRALLVQFERCANLFNELGQGFLGCQVERAHLLGESVVVEFGVEVNETQKVAYGGEHALADVVSGNSKLRSLIT